MAVGPVPVHGAEIRQNRGDCFSIIKFGQIADKIAPGVKSLDRGIIPQFNRIIIHGVFFADIIGLAAEHDAETGFAHESQPGRIIICGVRRRGSVPVLCSHKLNAVIGENTAFLVQACCSGKLTHQDNSN